MTFEKVLSSIATLCGYPIILMFCTRIPDGTLNNIVSGACSNRIRPHVDSYKNYLKIAIACQMSPLKMDPLPSFLP